MTLSMPLNRNDAATAILAAAHKILRPLWQGDGGGRTPYDGGQSSGLPLMAHTQCSGMSGRLVTCAVLIVVVLSCCHSRVNDHAAPRLKVAVP